jgi:hypothetical protein
LTRVVFQMQKRLCDNFVWKRYEPPEPKFYGLTSTGQKRAIPEQGRSWCPWDDKRNWYLKGYIRVMLQGLSDEIQLFPHCLVYDINLGMAVNHLCCRFQSKFNSLAISRWLPANCFILILRTILQNLGEQLRNKSSFCLSAKAREVQMWDIIL